MNGGLTGLGRHEGESLMTSFSFLGEQLTLKEFTISCLTTSNKTVSSIPNQTLNMTRKVEAGQGNKKNIQEYQCYT